MADNWQEQRAKACADEWFSFAPKYRTKQALIEYILRAMQEQRERDAEIAERKVLVPPTSTEPHNHNLDNENYICIVCHTLIKYRDKESHLKTHGRPSTEEKVQEAKP